MTISVGIYIYDGLEVLDFAGPYEVFTTASRVLSRTNVSDPVAFKVFTIARAKNAIRTRPGLIVQADYLISNHPAIDLLLVPGGIVTTELATPIVSDWISGLSPKPEIIASVCTGAFLLAKAGLLHAKTATTHWEDIDDMQKLFPSVKVLQECRWIDHGAIVTSAGISAGIDMSLHLVERLFGRQLAIDTAHQMEYIWHENT